MNGHQKIWVVFLLGVLGMPAGVRAGDRVAVGVQAKFIGGVGVALDVPLGERVYLHGSASTLLLTLDLAVGLGVRVTDRWDASFRFHAMRVAAITPFGGGEAQIGWLEPCVRWRLSRRFWLEAGVLLSPHEEEIVTSRWEVRKRLKVDTAPNIGLIIDVL
jgi:hypothetical protein